MPCQEILGEGFRALELRCSGTGAEAGQAGVLEAVDDAGDERRFGADNREVDSFLLRERDQGVDVVRRYRRIANLVLARRTRVARRDDDFVSGLRTFPRERMFAAAGSNDQNLHAANATVLSVNRQ